jgi:amino acid adenylation domain-containing protein
LGNSGPKNLQFLHSHLDGMGLAEDNIKSIYPCTPTQDGILFAQLNGHNYHNRFVATLTFTKGDISIDRVAGIWKSMCEAHDILRTIFTTGLSDQSAFQQIVLKRYEPSIAFAKMPTDRMDISQVVETQEKHPLDPEKPQHHLTLYQDSASVIHAVLDISHTLADAKTFQDLWKTIGSLYTEMSRGHTGTVSPGRPFSDFVIWLQSQQEDARRHWTEYLQGVSPCVFPRDHVENMDYQARGPIVPFNDARLLNSFCQQQGVTNAMFMQAAWALVLRIHTDRSVVCFGSARSDQEALPRDSSKSDILGPLISILPSKFDLQQVERLTTKDVLETSRNDASIAMGYSGCHLAELHDELGLRDSPLFDTIMTIQRSWLTDLSAGEGDLRIDITDVEDPTEFSIVVGVQYSATDLTIRLSHQRGVVSDLLIERIATTFSKVIEYMIHNVDQPLINLLETSFATRDLDLLKEWNSKSPVSVMDRNVSNVFQAHAKSQPDAPAVCSWDGDLNYAELDRLSDLLAYRLRVVHGVRADDVVPFCCVKSKSAIVSMLAIWKAGAALLPLDFSHPAERLTTIVDETKAKLVLINSSKRLRKIASCLPNGTVDLVDLSSLEQDVKSNDDVQSELSSFTIEPQHAGYLVYTSGSTGRPKGLVLHHQSLSTSSESMVPMLGLSPHSRILQLNNFVFDFGLLDVLFAFWAGACLCMPSEEEAASDVSAAIRRTRANYVECTPTYATLFNPQDSPTIKTVALGGEALKQENLDTWSPHARLMNAYGPGETGMSSCGDVAMNKDGTILQDIGRPGGCRYWVVNPDNSEELVPVGTLGELVIEGPIVGRGYVNNPQVQAASFVERPAWTHHPLFSGLELGKFRFYKSGDLVTQISKDSFVFAGRKDFQVKIRGQRMEIGEIEHQLNQQALGVDTWTVEAITRDDSQEQFLAAFSQVASGDALVCPNENHVLPPSPQTADAARLALQQTLPSYMVPEFFIPLRRIPTNSSMKTDRKALRGLVNTLSQAELVSYRATGNTAADSAAKGPTSPVVLHGLELVLQRAWASLLNIQALTIQPTDDFFALGGNSIRAMRLAAALRTSGYLLSVVDIFKSPTLAGMSYKMTELSSHQSEVAAKPRSAIQSLKPRLDLLAKTNPWLEASNIAGIAPTTDLQALMLSEGYLLGSETHVATLTLKPTSESGSNSMDLARLTQACQNTIRRHAILRTVFIQLEQSLVQLTLINPPVQQIHVVQPGGQHANGVSVSSDVLGILPKFSLSTNTNGLECSALTLRIHHAHYDATSMGIILNDLSNAYNATRTENQSSFLEWSSLIADPATHAKSYDFWRELLKGSMSYPLAPRVGVEQENQNMTDLQHHAAISVPASSLSSLDGTEATVLKAAWACVLSLVLDKQDTVFSFLSANRFSSLQPHLEAQRLVGPCINLVPVRASLGEGQKSLSTIVKELQQQSNDSLAHQHVGFRSIVKNCTQWPTIRFNSTILFQNHGELDSSLRFGNTECIVEGIGNGTNSADVWITATPLGDGSIDVRLRFSLDRVPLGLCHWTVTCFESLLDLLPRWWDRDISDIHAELIRLAGPRPLSLVHNEDYASASNGIDPEDPVHRALEARYFECA